MTNAAEPMRPRGAPPGVRNGHCQRLVALERANHVRMVRAELKRQLLLMDAPTSRAAGVVLLTDPPRVLDTMPVLELLRSCRGVGVKKAKRVAREARVSERRRLEQLTERERAAVAERLSRIGGR